MIRELVEYDQRFSMIRGLVEYSEGLKIVWHVYERRKRSERHYLVPRSAAISLSIAKTFCPNHIQEERNRKDPSSLSHIPAAVFGIFCGCWWRFHIWWRRFHCDYHIKSEWYIKTKIKIKLYFTIWQLSLQIL